MKTVAASELERMILDDGELALLDAREERRFAESHVFYASCCPLSRLEALAPLLVPRRGARVVTCDAGAGEAVRAAARLGALGYADVAVLEGGIAAWAAAGYVLFSGVNVPSKAFGEVVEHELGTPSVSAEELRAMIDAGEDPVILDSRPTPEFTNFSIPGGRCCPGAELAYRVHDAAPSPETTVVVNCAGRTRSIIGAQSIINAGVPNRVVALRNGTMAWHLAGFDLAKGATEHVARPSAAGIAKAKAAAARVAERFSVRAVDPATLDRWRAESEARSLFVFDVRTREEYEAGHLPDARWVAGGQLVQATDRHVGTLRSRIVLTDDDGVRATMTASWLVQMGWRDAVVLEGGVEGHALATGMPAPPVLGLDEARVEGIAPDALAAALDRGEAEVVDVSPSRAYRAGHVPGACHAVRARLGRALGGRSDPGVHGQAGDGLASAFGGRSDPGVHGQTGDGLASAFGDRPDPGVHGQTGDGLAGAFGDRPDPGVHRQAGDGLSGASGDRHSGRMLVLTSGSGALARLAAADAAAHVDAPVRALEGGNAAWAAAGYPLTAAEPRFLDEPDDVLVPIHEAEGGMEKAMNDYLAWEIALPGAVARDGTAAWLRTERGGAW